LLTLIAPDSMKTAPAKTIKNILGAEHELPTVAFVASDARLPPWTTLR
jgi:hypothetical protein